MNKLEDLSIGILSWHSKSLPNTLQSYKEHGLLDIAGEVLILFQEATQADRELAEYYGLNAIYLGTNVGIGQGFIELAEACERKYFMPLEHDWVLCEGKEETQLQLEAGIFMLNAGYKCVRYRHRENPGEPLYTKQFAFNEEMNFCNEIQLSMPHLLDCVHWRDNPADDFEQLEEYTYLGRSIITTTSRYGNWTNNPCLFDRYFYLDTVTKFAGTGNQLEGKISHWWARQNFLVAHTDGLFTHQDLGGRYEV